MLKTRNMCYAAVAHRTSPKSGARKGVQVQVLSAVIEFSQRSTSTCPLFSFLQFALLCSSQSIMLIEKYIFTESVMVSIEILT